MRKMSLVDYFILIEIFLVNLSSHNPSNFYIGNILIRNRSENMIYNLQVTKNLMQLVAKGFFFGLLQFARHTEMAQGYHI